MIYLYFVEHVSHLFLQAMDHANSPVNIIEGVTYDVESKNDFGGERGLGILLE